ncbi:uncharacterized protein LOC131216968 isoform X2 [Magnolia sinica]|uniref:uncharacterized protein LOC131216968 isoform X2 n=1 Tax=Magnolia sinica TaxID=86752 RepID=UPI00265B3DE2|nr:uncharacterized protein LOC131216968 isoform X2 [Magnolia sinica]XP_058067603.1 uncharacterized protein LOC131216968 isoform X2 [Magnolia sinica]
MWIQVPKPTYDVSLLYRSMKDMTAVSLPAISSANLDANMKINGNSMCMSSSEDQLQSLSRESMDQIRSTMLQHEELFKEQVRTLHKLYNVQKAAMQEIRKLICSPAQLSASNSNTNEACDDQIHSSVVEGKPLGAAYVCSQDYMEESNVPSTYPIHAAVESSGSNPQKQFSIDNMEAKLPPNVCNTMKRGIDLERPPEEYMDESDYQTESNNFDIQGANASSYSFMGCNRSVLQTGSYGAPSKSSQETCRDLGSKICTDYTKCIIGIQSLQDAFRRNILQDFSWNHLPAVGNCSISGESNFSLNQHERKPLWLLQQSTPITAERLSSGCKSDSPESEELHPERKTHEQVKASNLSPKNAYIPGSIDLRQPLESISNGKVPHSVLDEQLQRDSAACLPCSEPLLPSNPVMYPQVGSTHTSMLSHLKGPNVTCIQGSGDRNSLSCVLSCQTGENDGTEIPNCSGHGNNSPASQGRKACRDRDLSIVAVKSDQCGSDSGPVKVDHVEAGVQSEPKEAPQFTNDDFKPSLSPSVQVGTLTDCQREGEEPAMTKESEEELENGSTVEEACESIAAKILLSFAPCRSQCDAKWQCFETQIEMESSQSSRECTGRSNKQNRRVRRGLNYSNGVGVDAVKWMKSVRGRRRRTSRRQR